MKKMIFVCLADEEGNDRYQKMVWDLQMEYPEATFLKDPVRRKFISRISEGTDVALIFLIFMDRFGVNLSLERLLKEIASKSGCLEGATAAIIVAGEDELYTKSAARRVAFTLNCAGCLIPGKAFAEGTGSLHNLQNCSAYMRMEPEKIFRERVRKAVLAAVDYRGPACNRIPADCGSPRQNTLLKDLKNLLCIHSSIPGKSNTYDYWKLIEKELVALNDDIHIREINLQGENIRDCRGCPYEVCREFGEKRECFFGGIMTENVYPAVEKSDAVLLLCPNYNDALGADLTACINRLTALYRNVDFSGKYLYIVVVSGYSGGDLVASQAMDAMGLNKGFTMPGYAVNLQTANHPGELLRQKGIQKSAAEYAKQISFQLRFMD